MLKKLVALMTVLTASVFFTQTVVAAESYSVVKTENVKGKGLQKRQEKVQKKEQLQKKQQQRKTNKKGRK